MINPFNRKELTITFSMKEQAEIRLALAENDIDYTMKVVNRNSPSPAGDMRARTGTAFQDMGILDEYIFYVHKDDYERAKNVIRK